MSTTTTVQIPPAPSAPFGSVFGPVMAVARFDGTTWSSAGAGRTSSRSACTREPTPSTTAARASRASRPTAIPMARSTPFRHRAPTSPGCARARRGCACRCRRRRWSDALIDLAVAENAGLTPALARRPLPAPDAPRHRRHDRRRRPSERDRDPLRAGLPRRRLPPAGAPHRRRRDGDAAHDAAVRRRQDGRQLRHGAGADHGRPRAVRLPTRCCSRRAAWCRRPGRRTCCCSTATSVVTPALTDAYLHGVTRDSLLRLAASLGWRVTEREVTVADCVDVGGPPGRRGRPHRHGGRRRRRRHAGRRRRAAPRRCHRHQPAHRPAARALLDIQAGRTTFDW